MNTGMDVAMHRGYAGPEGRPNLLSDRWWAMLVRGLAAIAFGAVALVAPRTSLLILALVFGIYAVVDGLAHLIGAGRWTGEGKGWAVFQGVLSLAAGVIALAWPGLTAMYLIVVIAGWAALLGVAQIAVSMRLRRVQRGGWLLATAGTLSLALAVALFVAPAAGVAVMLGLIGGYAIVVGALLVALALRLRGSVGGATG